jgi:hypothetical protein
MRHQLGGDRRPKERGRRGMIANAKQSARGSTSLPALRWSTARKGSQRTRLLAAGRRQQAPPGGGQELGVGFRWREYRRAGAPELYRKALLAPRAATRRCRAPTRSSHARPPRSSPLVSPSLAALIGGAVEHSKVIPYCLAGVRALDRPKARSYAKCLAAGASAATREDRGELGKVPPSPRKWGAKPDCLLVGAAGVSGGRVKKYTVPTHRQQPNERGPQRGVRRA